MRERKDAIGDVLVGWAGTYFSATGLGLFAVDLVGYLVRGEWWTSLEPVSLGLIYPVCAVGACLALAGLAHRPARRKSRLAGMGIAAVFAVACAEAVFLLTYG